MIGGRDAKFSHKTSAMGVTGNLLPVHDPSRLSLVECSRPTLTRTSLPFFSRALHSFCTEVEDTISGLERYKTTIAVGTYIKTSYRRLAICSSSCIEMHRSRHNRSNPTIFFIETLFPRFWLANQQACQQNVAMISSAVTGLGWLLRKPVRI